jgi:hypothetical protein
MELASTQSGRSISISPFLSNRYPVCGHEEEKGRFGGGSSVVDLAGLGHTLKQP